MAAQPETFIYDKAHQEKLTEVLIEALLKGMMDPESRTVVLRSGDLCEVLLKLQAMFIGPAFSSRSALRQWTENYGRRLYRAAIEAQAVEARDGPFAQHVHIDGPLQ